MRSRTTLAIAAALVAVSAAFCAGSSRADAPHKRVVNGSLARYADAPWAVYLPHVGCTGSAINAYFVLTAAHCLRHHRTPKSVRYGNTNKNRGVRDRVKWSIWNQDYKSQQGGNDFGLIRVKHPLRTYPIGLNVVQNLAVGLKLFAWGWGDTSYGRGYYPKRLYWGAVDLYPYTSCDAVLPDQLSPGELCAGNVQTHTDTCPGDSGGPLTYRYGPDAVEVGVTSWGTKRCGIPGLGAYESVAHSAWLWKWVSFYGIQKRRTGKRPSGRKAFAATPTHTQPRKPPATGAVGVPHS
jgi:secreted trypsin-like serine protease